MNRTTRKKLTRYRVPSAGPSSNMTRQAGTGRTCSECPRSEAHSDVNSGANGEGHQAAQDQSFEGSENLA